MRSRDKATEIFAVFTHDEAHLTQRAMLRALKRYERSGEARKARKLCRARNALNRQITWAKTPFRPCFVAAE